MIDKNELELISFKICPFVQRSVIALQEKGVDFKLTHIDLGNPPDWFKEISPLGKVPVLKVGDKVLFESAVIAEYLDEVYPPQLHPADPLDKAEHRAWMEFGSELLMTQFRMSTAKEQSGFEENRDSLKSGLHRLAKIVDKDGPFFSGKRFALVDAVYAPLFMRLKLVDAMHDLGFEMDKRLQQWSEALLARDSVKTSVVDDFDSLFLGFMKKQEGYLFTAVIQ